MRDRLPLLAGLVVLALAIGLGSVALAGGIRDRNRNDVITVTGSAKKRITADYVVWDLSATSQQRTAPDAARELGGWTSRIRSFFAHEGVQSAELTVEPIATETVGTSHGVTSCITASTRARRRLGSTCSPARSSCSSPGRSPA